MKTFYSILYCPIIPEAKENISVGLYLKGDREFLFRYSKHKLSYIQKMVDKEAFHLLQMNLKSIERSIQKGKNRILESKDTLLPIEEIGMLSESYFSYLSKSSRNFLSFSKPESIDFPINKEIFKRLFEKFIYKHEYDQKEIEKKADVINKVKYRLKAKIENKVNWDFRVTDEYIQKLLFPVKADFIGKNGHYVSGSFIDFQKSETALINDVAKQFELIRSLKENDQNAKCFVLANEPTKELKEQHKIWKNIYSSKLIHYLELKDFEQVIDYANITNVEPICKHKE